MHFSIPSVEEVECNAGTKYHVYRVYVNGVLHCTPRYSDFRHFSDALKHDLNLHNESISLPPFPPKRLLQLTTSQLEERRSQLERYLQAIASHPKLVNNAIFTNFLFTFHEKLMDIEPKPVLLDVFLMNGNKLTIPVLSNERVSSVLMKFVTQIRLNTAYTDYFALYLMRKQAEGDITVLRRIQAFEAPYLSLQDVNLDGSHKLVIRKSFWCPQQESEIMDDPIAVNLLFVQAVSDLDRGWIQVPDDARLQHLNRLRHHGSKKDCLQFCRTLRFYGFLHLKHMVSDWPRPNTPVEIAIGANELVFQYLLTNHNHTDAEKETVVQHNASMQETCFSIVRIRTWCITTTTAGEQSCEDVSAVHRQSGGLSSVQDNNSANSGGSSSAVENRHELSFEYLLAPGEMQWIRVVSSCADQIILLSMSLQSLVDELLRVRQGVSLRKCEESGGTVQQRNTSSTELQPAATRRSSLEKHSILVFGGGSGGPRPYSISRGGIGDQDL